MNQIPFTQAWEDAKRLVGDRRSDEDTESLYKSMYNLIYAKAIPQVLEWDMLRADLTPILVNADYQTGTLTMTSGSAAVTLASGTFPSAMGAGWKLRVLSGSDADDVYDILTRDSGTTATLARAFQGTTASSLSYIVYQDLMSLPSNFDRFTVNPKIYTMQGGRPKMITFKEDGQFFDRQIGRVGTPSECRLSPDKDSSGNYQLQFNCGWDEDTLIYGEYIKLLDDLVEYTTGTVAVTNASTTVTGTGTLFSTNVSAGQYFRVDSTREWYLISSVGSAAGIVLASSYKGATASGVSYTICDAPTSIPSVWQSAITYGIAALAASHQDDNVGYARWQRLSGIPESVLSNLARAENRLTYGNQRMRTIYQTQRGARR